MLCVCMIPDLDRRSHDIQATFIDGLRQGYLRSQWDFVDAWSPWIAERHQLWLTEDGLPADHQREAILERTVETVMQAMIRAGEIRDHSAFKYWLLRVCRWVFVDSRYSMPRSQSEGHEARNGSEGRPARGKRAGGIGKRHRALRQAPSESVVEQFRRQLLSKGYDLDSASNLAQEFRIRFARGAHKLRDRAAMPSWLRKVRNSVVVDDIRVKERERKAADDPRWRGTATRAGAIDPTDAIIEAIDIRRALKELSQIDEELILLTVVYGLNAREIGEHLEEPESSLRQRIEAARAKLAQLTAG